MTETIKIIARTALAVLVVSTGGFFADAAELGHIGRGTAIVFSPDFSDPENRLFYESLGFLYLETADWREALDRIRDHNRAEGVAPVTTLIVESHGTNGNGLKLQEGKDPEGARSYISIGGLQQNLDRSGVTTVILSACNAGRLTRPEIYYRLDPAVDDPLFLPATRGVLDADPGYDRDWSRVRILRREESNLESLLHATTDELSPDVRRALGDGGESWRFAVSTMLIQLLVRDSALRLVDDGFVREKSRADLSPSHSEKLFRRFARHLHEQVARGDRS